MNRKKEIAYAIKKIREWDNLTLLEKICRKKEKPSIVDYKLANAWIYKHDTGVAKAETEEKK